MKARDDERREVEQSIGERRLGSVMEGRKLRVAGVGAGGNLKSREHQRKVNHDSLALEVNASQFYLIWLSVNKSFIKYKTHF